MPLASSLFSTPEPQASRESERFFWAVLWSSVVLVGLAYGSGKLPNVTLLGSPLKNALVGTLAPDSSATEPVFETTATLAFTGTERHPDLIFHPYLGAQADEIQGHRAADLILSARDYFEMFRVRQAVDDNFTIRVLDGRTGETLEVFVLEDERNRFEATGRANWDAIDRLRRTHTTQLVDRYEASGMQRSDVTIRWGRATQVAQARENERGIIHYEMELAERLGLSLLSTEIGTVETFNNDRLVSSVGARSRYQMMPSVLRDRGLSRYQLQTGSRRTIPVSDELHPLLAMEASFITLKGYTNAVGHELPGMSSYHTGPGNIFNLYTLFLTHANSFISRETNVIDAYFWAITEGFPQVSESSSFKNHSRSYVAAAYGALKATEHLVIDPEDRLVVDRVQLRADTSLYLSQLLRRLRQAGFEWPEDVETLPEYDQFVALNPHFGLPEREGTSPSVPVNGDVNLVRVVGNSNVRFFLPLGAIEALPHLFDATATLRFDENTYTEEVFGERTRWDEAYDELVARIKRFGFTEEARAELRTLSSRFDQLAAQNPSRFRQMQRDIIRVHRGIWGTRAFDRVLETVAATRDLHRVPTRPLQRITPAPQRPLALEEGR